VAEGGCDNLLDDFLTEDNLEGRMPKLRTVVIASALGAAASYFFDAEQGAGRRAQARDQLGAAVRRGRRNLRRTAMRLENTSSGRLTQLRQGRDTAEVDDLTLLDRVESELFGKRGFPKDRVNAEVVDCRLTLRGELDSDEQIEEVVNAAGAVDGVVEVVSLLHLPGTPAPNKAAARRVQ
jgi:BON domain